VIAHPADLPDSGVNDELEVRRRDEKEAGCESRSWYRCGVPGHPIDVTKRDTHG
jgi:hypothetical protein